MQGICGNMDGEKLFEFSDHRRCVYWAGHLMAASYQTSHHCPSQARQLISSHLFEQEDINYCPRSEGKPTILKI